jgi:hypothetical protein
MVPCQAILEQFDRAQEECQDPSKLAAWIPMLSQYGPDLLIQCEHASKLSQQLAEEWLGKYMFKSEKDGKKRAKEIALWLSNHGNFRSHGRHINRDAFKAKGMVIEFLENDQDLQDLVLSVFHAATHTFNDTPVVKIIENQLGRSFLKQLRIVPIGGQHQPEPTNRKTSKSSPKSAMKKKKGLT